LDEVEATDRIERMELALDVVERAALLATVEPVRVSPTAAEVHTNDAPGLSPVLVTQHGLAQHGTLV
jgi:hypothetical protein